MYRYRIEDMSMCAFDLVSVAAVSAYSCVFRYCSDNPGEVVLAAACLSGLVATLGKDRERDEKLED